MVAALLGEEPSRLRDVPADPRRRGRHAGCSSCTACRSTSTRPRTASWSLDPTNVERAHVADIDAHAGSSRIPILFCGPLLHRLGEAFIPDLGGCRIGDRPINYHLDVLRAVRRRRREAPGAASRLPRPATARRAPSWSCPTRASAPPSRCCSPRCAPRASPSCATPPIEPEIMDLIAVLQKMGAIISVRHRPGHPRSRASTGSAASPHRRSRTGSRRRPGPARRSPPAATSPSAAPGSCEMMTVPQRVPEGRRRASTSHDDGHPVLAPGRRRCSSLALETDVHPGFMTDWQQPLVVALTQANGLSIVHETVYENRLRLHRRAERDGRADPALPRVPGWSAVPLRPAQLPALGGRLRADQAARRRHHRPGPARRVQPPDRGAGRRGHARACTASTSSTAATSTSGASSTPSARSTSGTEPARPAVEPRFT